EELMIYQGDLFVGAEQATRDEDFAIVSKPPSTVLAMRHLVHDTLREPAALYKQGWPLRWSAETGSNGWKEEVDDSKQDVAQRFVTTEGEGESWLRYRHYVPTQEDWAAVERGESPRPRAKLVDDFHS